MVNEQPLWGGPPELTAWEALMWRAEADPRTRSTGILLETLATEPAWSDFRATISKVVEGVPRLRDRVVEPPLPLVQPVWSPDPSFELDNHVSRIHLTEVDDRSLMKLCEELLYLPIDRSRPPWEAVLVTGLPRGQAAFLFKQHHCLTDGTGLIQLLALAHADVPAASGTTPQRTPSDLLTRGVAARLAATPRTLVRLVAGSVSGMGQVAARPLEVVGRGVEFAASLKRMLTPPSVRRSPLLLGTGTKPLLVLLDASLADLKAAGKAADGSLNDAFVAAMLGGARRYHDAHGVRRDHVPVAMPVSLRKAGDPHGGNRFAGVRFAGPMSEADPVRRMRKIHELVEAVRDEPAIGFLDYLAPGLTKLPTAAIVELSVSMTSSVDLQVSNIRGLEQEVTMAGATVTGMYPLGPRPGVAAMIAMITYDGKCCIGINADAEVIDDVEVFEQCFRDGLDEVVGVVGRPRTRRARSDR